MIGYDTTHCTGQGCVLKPTCERYLAPHNPYGQSFFSEPPVKDGKCEYYIKVKIKPCVGHANQDDE